MGEDLLRYLPSEIIVNILSRLDVRTAVRCKCVCKPWLDLLASPEFVKSHLSKSVPGLAVIERKLNSKTYKMVEFVDELDLNCDWHRLNTAFNLDLPFREPMQGSTNGLIFLGGFLGLGDLILCNPVTREYMTIPCPRQPVSKTPWEIYGFGVSRMSGQYKVFRIFQKSLNFGHFEYQVYTVGSGLWRRIGNGKLGHVVGDTTVEFLSGNLHWWEVNGGAPISISCLDLETELFSTFSHPVCFADCIKGWNLSILRGCLCVCANSSLVQNGLSYEIDIWVMKEYGDEKSWTKEFTIRKVDIGDYLGNLYPIKVFKDGGILMTWARGKPLYYSSKTKTIQEIDLFESESYLPSHIMIYTPTFLSLKTFATEDVRSF